MMLLRKYLMITALFLGLGVTSCGQSKNDTYNNNQETNTTNFKGMSDSSKWNDLTPEEERVIVNKGTEMAFTGEYTDNKASGTYICRRCNAPLYKSEDKFNSHCGWPSFDDEIEGAVDKQTDADGRRTEILCANCDGHLGHVFYGEGFTSKDTRHCVNSISMTFIPEGEEIPGSNDNMDTAVKADTVYFASGCFWGTEYHMEKAEGVISTQVGYIGGHKDNPTYEEVCAKTTGHAEAVRVIYDPSKTDYETLCKLFFETHDPTQLNRQGPDIGDQYRTEVFYTSEEQKEITEKLIKILEDDGLDVVTKVTPAPKFWDAEDYHEHYYAKKNGTPYCHAYTKRF